jgi:hypothetical protein
MVSDGKMAPSEARPYREHHALAGRIITAESGIDIIRNIVKSKQHPRVRMTYTNTHARKERMAYYLRRRKAAGILSRTRPRHALPPKRSS